MGLSDRIQDPDMFTWPLRPLRVSALPEASVEYISCFGTGGPSLDLEI